MTVGCDQCNEARGINKEQEEVHKTRLFSWGISDRNIEVCVVIWVIKRMQKLEENQIKYASIIAKNTGKYQVRRAMNPFTSGKAHSLLDQYPQEQLEDQRSPKDARGLQLEIVAEERTQKGRFL